MTRNKKLYLISALMFAFANLFVFLIFFIPGYIIDAEIAGLEYARVFLTKFIEFALPPAAAMLLYLGGSSDGWKRALLRGLYLTLPRIIYLLPYYYLYHTAEGLSSAAAFVLAALITLFGSLILFGQIILLYEVLRVSARLVIRKSLVDDLPSMYNMKNMPRDMRDLLDKKAEDSLKEIPEKPGVFDFSAPVTVGIFSAVFGKFLMNFVYEIIYTVDYLVTYAGYYRVGEIIYITSSFLFTLIELITVHIICYYIKFKVCKKRASEDNSNEGKL